MSMRTRVVLVVLGLLPRLAAGAGSVGPLERIQSFPGFRGAGVKEMIRAGDLAFFTVQGTYVPQTLWRSDGTALGTFALDATLGLRFWTVQGSRVFYTRPASRQLRAPRARGPAGIQR
ncbi:MAG: hypothetical protein ACJ76J_05255 [Thermoanaerobaculia bacterium]